MKRIMSHRRAMRLHAERRAEERHGLTPDDVRAVQKMIRRANKRVTRFLASGPSACGAPVDAWCTQTYPGGTRSRWRVSYQGKTFALVYDNVTERIVTSFPDGPPKPKGEAPA